MGTYHILLLTFIDTLLELFLRSTKSSIPKRITRYVVSAGGKSHVFVSCGMLIVVFPLELFGQEVIYESVKHVDIRHERSPASKYNKRKPYNGTPPPAVTHHFTTVATSKYHWRNDIFYRATRMQRWLVQNCQFIHPLSYP